MTDDYSPGDCPACGCRDGLRTLRNAMTMRCVCKECGDAFLVERAFAYWRCVLWQEAPRSLRTIALASEEEFHDLERRFGPMRKKKSAAQLLEEDVATRRKQKLLDFLYGAKKRTESMRVSPYASSSSEKPSEESAIAESLEPINVTRREELEARRERREEINAFLKREDQKERNHKSGIP